MGHVSVHRFLLRLERLKTTHVDRLASSQLPDDDPDLRVVGPGRERTIRRVTIEVDELAQHLLKVGLIPDPSGLPKGPTTSSPRTDRALAISRALLSAVFAD